MSALTCYFTLLVLLVGGSVVAFWRQAYRVPLVPTSRPKRKRAPRWWRWMVPVTWLVAVPLSSALALGRGLDWGVPLLLGALSVTLMHAHLDQFPLVGEARKRKPKPDASAATPEDDHDGGASAPAHGQPFAATQTGQAMRQAHAKSSSTRQG